MKPSNAPSQSALAFFEQEKWYQKGVEDGVKRGYKAGAEQTAHKAVITTEKMLLGAFALVLHRDFGFGQQRLERALNTMREWEDMTFSTEEMAEKVWEELGLVYCENDPVPRFEKRSDNG